MTTTLQEMGAFAALMGGIIAGIVAIWSVPLPDYLKSLGTSLIFILLLFVYVNLAFEKKQR